MRDIHGEQDTGANGMLCFAHVSTGGHFKLCMR